MTSFSPREIVSELDRYIVGQKDAKRAVAIALRNRWRRQQLTGDLREEVLPKNILMIGPTGVRQDRDLAAAGQARRRAVPQGGGHQVHRGRLRRPRRRFHRARPGRGRHRPDARDAAQGGQGAGREERRGARARRPGRPGRPAGDARGVPQEAARPTSSTTRRSRSRWPRRAPQFPTFDIPGGQMGMINIQRDAGQGAGPAHQAAQAVRRPGLRHPDRAGERQPARPGPGAAGGGARGGERRHRLPRRDRQDLRALGGRPRRRRRVARGRAARPAAAARGHDGVDQVRAGEDRPRAVHRLGRVPRRQAVRPAARAAGPPADPRRAEAADDGGPARAS